METKITDCIGFLSAQLPAKLSSIFDEMIKDFSLTHKQAGLLWKCHHERASQTHLCEFTSCDKNYIRFLIDDLEQKGLVYREKNPKNRRENIICLTEEGKKVAVKTFQLMLSYQEKILLQYISKEEMQALHSILLKLYKLNAK